MKVILVARNALAAYLISSDVRRPVNRIGRIVEVERAIDFAHHALRARVLGADDDAVGALEVADRRAFAQEFGVGDDRDLHVGRVSSRRISSTLSPVPTGTVDLVTTTTGRSTAAAISRVASNT